MVLSIKRLSCLVGRVEQILKKKKFESIYSHFGKLDRSDSHNISLDYETV
jgi:hypothetical protein